VRGGDFRAPIGAAVRQAVAALYVEENGVYANLTDVEVWGISRDARLYAGPHPVVAHPPCQLWTNMAAVNFKRYGGEHNRPGNDGGCFKSAMWSVRHHGGVLEHPAGSKAWKEHGLQTPPPPGFGWLYAGPWNAPYRDSSTPVNQYVCEVWQSAYGHKARKRTWLYYVGLSFPAELDWSRKPGTHQVGWFDRIKPTLSKKAASATPLAFRDALLELARRAFPTAAAPAAKESAEPPVSSIEKERR
jgi:hypothetical protein